MMEGSREMLVESDAERREAVKWKERKKEN